jgi:hypothetical protein
MLSNVKLSSVKVDYYDPDRVRFLIEQYCTEHKIKKAEYAVLIGLRPESLSRVISRQRLFTGDTGENRSLGQCVCKRSCGRRSSWGEGTVAFYQAKNTIFRSAYEKVNI